MVFRAGIVGCGLMGTLHARTLAALPDVQVVAVQNHTPAKADQLAAEVGARRFDTVDDLVRSDVDAVWVCTPDFAHVEPSLAVLDAGKHLFLEKSLATTMEDGRTILRAAESHPELKALLGYPLRFDPRYRRMKEILSEPDAGRTAMAWSLRTHFLDKTQRVYDKYRDEYYDPPSWYWREDAARGPVYSHASHDYDLFSWFCGPIERVFVYGGTYLLDPGDVADGFTVSVRFAGGAVATISTPWVTRVEYDFVGVATQGLTVTNQNGTLHLKRAGAAEEEVIAFENPDMWVPMATHFIRCIQEDQPPLVSIADGYRAIAVATAAYRSLKEGREMMVEG